MVREWKIGMRDERVEKGLCGLPALRCVLVSSVRGVAVGAQELPLGGRMVSWRVLRGMIAAPPRCAGRSPPITWASPFLCILRSSRCGCSNAKDLCRICRLIFLEPAILEVSWVSFALARGDVRLRRRT